MFIYHTSCAKPMDYVFMVNFKIMKEIKSNSKIVICKMSSEYQARNIKKVKFRVYSMVILLTVIEVKIASIVAWDLPHTVS